MRKQRLGLGALFGSVLTLSACGSPPTEEIEDYDQFQETINADDFTGFAMYIYSPDVDESKENVFQVFEDTSATLTYTNGWEDDQETKERANDDSRARDFISPYDRVTYIEDGEIMGEYEVDGDDIKQEEYEGELQSFVEKYAE
ncbi:hypothetical protein [Marinococcus halotolerans]|uniref:hypothetical protein n=1 Tax=Marinococcus halotolerans TaxID=301092 RepID=UPI0003B5B3B9|nr:hypothetical protein [Marinococcus halotolerans]